MAGKARAFTITDYERDIDFYKERLYQYVLLGEERCPTTGRLHWQGWIYFKNPRSLNAVMKEFKPRHIEVRIRSTEENEAYCRKEGNVILEDGECPKQGERTDIEGLKKMIKSQVPIKEIFESQPGNFIRYQRGIQSALSLYQEKRNWKMDVRIYWGKPETGKTRAVYEEFGNDIYQKMIGKWWDGYEGETCVLIDDFDPDNCFETAYDFYLKLLDRYPLRIEMKGGSCQFRSKTIIITSNFDPEVWFPEKRNRSAFFRRVTEIREFGDNSDVDIL